MSEELITIGDKTYHRDPDVFDTWFSSGSWPYATLGFGADGHKSDDFKTFYPLALMETGFDILAPWVSRMIMLGLYVTGEVPFKTVYLHGLILDPQGQKMSKSKGNVVNPVGVIDEYGSDALRMGLLMGQTPGSNQPYSPAKVVGARNFANKLWNIARFIEDKIGDDYKGRADAEPESAADHWVLSKIQQCIETMNGHMEDYRFSEAYEVLYHFVWDDFADWFVEASKAAPNTGLLAHCLEAILKLAHPFAPFVTETIWQTLSWEGEKSILAREAWPKAPHFDKNHAQTFEEIKTIVTEARYIISALKATDVTLYYTDVSFLTDNAGLIKRLARLRDVTEVRDGAGLYLTDTKYRCWLDIDINAARAYQKELGEKRQQQQKVIAQLESRLSNKSYVDNAPHHIVTQTRDQLKEAREQLESINKEYERYGAAEA